MLFCEKLEAILTDVTLKGEDADVREYDKEINDFLNDNVDELFISLLKIMKENENVPVKRLIIEFWKEKLLYIEKNTPHEYWTKLNKDTRDCYKKELFQLLSTETSQVLQEELCLAIGGIIITIQSINITDDDEDIIEKEKSDPVPDDAKEWPEIPQILQTLVNADSASDNSSAYLIMTSCFSSEYPILDVDLKKIETWIKIGLQNSSPQVRLSAIGLVLSMAAMEDEYVTACCASLPIVLGLLKSIVETNPNLHSKAHEMLFSFYHSLPKKTQRKHLVELFEISKLMFSNEDQNKADLNQLILHVLCEAFVNVESFVAKKKNLLEEYAEMIFHQVAITTEDVTEEWARPPEGYNEEEVSSKEDDFKEQILEDINLLVSLIPEPDQILPIIEARVKHKLATGDWKARYFDLMVKSQIASSLGLDEASEMIEASLIHLKDPHAKVRYATLQLIGQACEDMAPDFQYKNQKLISIFYEGLVTEEVPRVLSHHFAGLLNFFHETVNPNVLGSFNLAPFVNIGLKHSVEGISYVREAAISFIAGLAEVMKEKLEPYISEAMEVILKVCNSTGKEYMNLRGRGLEAATLWLSYVPGVKSYSEQILKLSIESLNEFVVIDENSAPLKVYVIQAFNRLVHSAPEKIEVHVKEVFPRLIDLTQNLLISKAEGSILGLLLSKIKKTRMGNDMEDNTGEKEQEFLYNDEDICIGLQALILALSDLQKAMVPYTENFVAFYKKSILATSASHGQIMSNLIHGAASLLTMVKATTSNEDFLKMYHEFFEFLHKNLPKSVAEFVDISEDIIRALNMFYEVADNVLTTEEIGSALLFLETINAVLAEKKVLLLKDVESNKDVEEGEEDDDAEEKLRKTEEEQVALLETLGSLVKNNQKLITEQFSKGVITFYTSFLKKPENLQEQTKFQIVSFPICDLFEYFSPDHPLVLKHLEKTMLPILEFGGTHPVVLCRQTTSYAIGVFAQNSKNDTFNKYQHKLLGLLKQLSKRPDGPLAKDFIDDTITNEVAFLVDNIGGAYGKILKSHENTLNQSAIVNEWLRYLPLKADQPEMQRQHEFFADLILGPKFELLCGENQERKDLITQKITEVREKSEMIEDQMIKRKIENAYLKLTKTD